RLVAVVFARASPQARTPAPLLLVCRVTGFYPRPVRVAWLQDGEEVGPGGRLSSSGILPNADLTYQLRSSLAVEPGDGHSYACRVEHSSLGGQSLLIPWVLQCNGAVHGSQLRSLNQGERQTERGRQTPTADLSKQPLKFGHGSGKTW
ncbi:unnamed protein product, partial [Caretta caretta]